MTTLSRSLASRSIAWLSLAFSLLLGLLASGCAGGLTLTHLNSEEKKPNNVWVFYTVERGEEPVAGLTAEDFHIYEDDKRVSIFESKQVILNPDVAAVMYTLLLVDASGSITESGQMGSVVDAAKLFTERVEKTQRVAVYAFDGEEKIHPVVPFTEVEGALQGGLDGLRERKPKDPSTDLHGAVVQALKTLKIALDKDPKPLKFGTLVVFSDGADRAGRVSHEEMLEEINKPDYEHFDLFAIGIGDESELESGYLGEIGRDGTEEGQDHSKVTAAFDKIAQKIAAHSKRFYLLSYCTPSRKGEHIVRIEVSSEKAGGGGSLEYTFKADGFGPPPTCDPERKPTFGLDQIEKKPDAAEE